MSYIFESFKDWNKKVNEDNTLDKLKIRNDIDQKMIIKVINDRTFKVRAKWGGDVIDALSNLTQTGWSRIMQEINNTIPEGGRYPLINSMPPLKDLTKNIVVYEVIKDTDTAKDPNPNIKKQSFQFTVVPRPVGVPTNIEFVSRDDVNSLPKTSPSQLSQSTDVKTGEVLAGPKKSGETYGLNLSKGAIALTNLTDPKLINLIDAFYFKVSEDGGLSENPQVKAILKGIKAELVAKTLGDNSKTLISALNAAFSITTRYGDPETGITQTLLNNMANAKSKENEGTLLSEIEGFNTGAFLANLKPISNIVAPAGGFVKGKVTKDPEFTKFQQLLITKFQKSLGATPIYKKFAKFQVGGADGTFGTNTANLVNLLKQHLTDPKWTGNMDPNNVDQAFIDRINQEKVAESYISLDGFTLVVEGLDMVAINAAGSGGGSAGGSGGGSSRVGGTSTVSSSSKFREVPDLSGYEFKVVDGFWNYKKKSDTTWQKTFNTNNITFLQKNFPEDKGSFVRQSKPNYKYKLENGTWKVWLGGKWVDAPDTDQQELKTLYGSSNTGKPTSKALTPDKIDTIHQTMAYRMAKWFKDNSFKDYKGEWTPDDDEDGAWNEFMRKWNTGSDSIKANLEKTRKAIALLPEGDEKTRLTKNQGVLDRIPKESSNVGTLYTKFMGGTTDDTYVLKLRKNNGDVFRLSIDTDF
jgi:hypothetical protein